MKKKILLVGLVLGAAALGFRRLSEPTETEATYAGSAATPERVATEVSQSPRSPVGLASESPFEAADAVPKIATQAEDAATSGRRVRGRHVSIISGTRKYSDALQKSAEHAADDPDIAEDRAILASACSEPARANRMERLAEEPGSKSRERMVAYFEAFCDRAPESGDELQGLFERLDDSDAHFASTLDSVFAVDPQFATKHDALSNAA